MNKPGIEEAVVMLMQHALQVNPAQPSWLRTQADIYFGANIIYILFLKNDLFFIRKCKHVYGSQ